LPPLLAQAEQMAGTVLLGDHGRRRAGMGDDFWQYRPVQTGDSYRMIDWRRSARSDAQYVREREWQVAQSVMLWLDQGASMQFASDEALPSKMMRARVLALAVSILLVRAGERVGLTGNRLPPRRGEAQIARLTEAFLNEDASAAEGEYAAPDARAMLPHARAVFVSDFLGDIDGIWGALTKAADRGVRGVLLQVLDPSEESFPFQGRTVFQSIGGGLSHETRKAGDLRDRYMTRLAERRDALDQLCRRTGWQFHSHTTGQSAQSALLWLYRALEQSR
jgi:uncharacterized protein (DUF58 family)